MTVNMYLVTALVNLGFGWLFHQAGFVVAATTSAVLSLAITFVALAQLVSGGR
jgi:hypothetical protein